ncbi:MAG: TraR/DksA C4-type zinc finger protein [bacterium]
MAKKNKTTVSAKRKTGQAAKPSVKPLLIKKKPSSTAPSKAKAKPVVRIKPSASKARQPLHPAPTSKAAKQPPVKAAVKHAAIDQKTLDHIRVLLIRIRDRLSGQIHSQSNDSLKYVDDASSEDRTDDFDREFALNLVSAEHDVLFEVNSALRRIDDEVYGMCDDCNKPIDKVRLHALPFARTCIKCQSEHERGRNHFRPFGETISQHNEPTGDAEETETEEHE